MLRLHVQVHWEILWAWGYWISDVGLEDIQGGSKHPNMLEKLSEWTCQNTWLKRSIPTITYTLFHIGPNVGSRSTGPVTSHDTQWHHMIPNAITICTAIWPSSLKCIQKLETRNSRFVGTTGQNGIALSHQWTNAANIGYKASNINFFPIFCNVDLLAHSAVPFP